MKLIVGLGNPGDQYKNTRHNLGFEVINALAHKLDLQPDHWDNSSKFKSMVCKYKGNEGEIILAKPQTFMNNSGMGVKALMDFYKVAPENVILIHDEIDIKLGLIKVRMGGSSAGHRGVESVLQQLGTDNFIRVRLGIGPEEKHAMDNVDKFVVAEFDAHEKSKVKHMIKRAVMAMEILLKDGLSTAQNQFN